MWASSCSARRAKAENEARIYNANSLIRKSVKKEECLACRSDIIRVLLSRADPDPDLHTTYSDATEILITSTLALDLLYRITLAY